MNGLLIDASRLHPLSSSGHRPNELRLNQKMYVDKKLWNLQDYSDAAELGRIDVKCKICEVLV